MTLQSVAKTIQVLEALRDSPEGRASVSDLSRALDWSRAATHQYLSSLAEVGWLIQNAKREYLFSPRTAVFARFAVQFSQVPVAVSEEMTRLVGSLNEPISYAMLNGNEAIIVERREPKRPFAISQALEPHLDLHTSASGLALLAYDSRVNAIHREGLEETLNDVRARGYAESHSHWLGDMVDVVAVPIMLREECMGVVSVIAPSGRLDLDLARESMLDARARLESRLGAEA